mmetsp:Transcript_60154/g.158933  ORF Transcript_60154/g.158933 Transcript_60154/m.158933 type:complete len:205 (+) Transcript_60154:228-842(+)
MPDRFCTQERRAESPDGLRRTQLPNMRALCDAASSGCVSRLRPRGLVLHLHVPGHARDPLVLGLEAVAFAARDAPIPKMPPIPKLVGVREDSIFEDLVPLEDLARRLHVDVTCDRAVHHAHLAPRVPASARLRVHRARAQARGRARARAFRGGLHQARQQLPILVGQREDAVDAARLDRGRAVAAGHRYVESHLVPLELPLLRV